MQFKQRELFTALILVLSAGVSLAQSYPARPIRLIVPTAPGGGLDVIARVIAPSLTESLGKSVVADNRSGASGVIAMDITAHAAPDGTEGVGSTPQQFAAHIKAEREKWNQAIKQAGISIQ